VCVCVCVCVYPSACALARHVIFTSSIIRVYRWHVYASMSLYACMLCVFVNTSVKQVLRHTSSSTEAHKANGVYWYFYPGNSFGFSRSARVDVAPYDCEHEDSEYRLSWLLDGRNGGYRIGDIQVQYACIHLVTGSRWSISLLTVLRSE